MGVHTLIMVPGPLASYRDMMALLLGVCNCMSRWSARVLISDDYYSRYLFTHKEQGGGEHFPAGPPDW